MSKGRRSDPKVEALRKQRLLNPRPDGVTDALFREHDFFDAIDLLQVKYEMIRRVELDGRPVKKATEDFGLSRPTFYQAQSTFHQYGLAGLIPKKRGPHGGHKLTNEVVTFLENARSEEESLDAKALARLARERFGVNVHPRSIRRALNRKEKKRR